MEKIRSIKLFGNYYKEFYVAQTAPVRDKINQVLKLIETQRLIPAKLTKVQSLYCFMASKRKVKRRRQKKSDVQKQ